MAVTRNRPAGPASRMHVAADPVDDWREQAQCRDEDPELFFPIGTSGPAIRQTEQAKDVCNRCHVANQCLKWALDHGCDDGVWGGMDEDDRRALKQRTTPAPAPSNRRPPTACGTYAGYQRHRNRGETACDQCRAAAATHSRARRSRQADELAASRG